VRKTILGHDDHPVTSSSSEWFGVQAIAGIAVTSEADDAPVENALYPPTATPAGGPESPAHRSFKSPLAGQQRSGTFNLFLGNRSSQGRRNLRLRCSVAGGERREVIRQQWTFSPQGSTEEVEDYRVTLDDVVVLELAIVPDINNGGAHASLVQIRIG
jgi:hypothetical protein